MDLITLDCENCHKSRGHHKFVSGGIVRYACNWCGYVTLCEDNQMYIIVWRKRIDSTKNSGPYYMKEESRAPFTSHMMAQEEAKRLASVNQDFIFYVAKLVTEVEYINIKVTQL